jgi:hypothetical protein
MMRIRSFIFALVGIAVLMLMWQLARADAPSVSHPAQVELRLLLPSLLESEAEHASVAYLPGVGAVITLDLVRGPNTIEGKTPHDGTRDWAIYLMRTFGPRVTSLPPNEIIAMSIDFYDYTDTVYHQLVITSSPATIADPNSYTILLNGKPYAEAAGQLGAAPVGTATAVAPPAQRSGQAQQAIPPTVVVPPAPAAAPAAPVQATGPLSVTLDFADQSDVGQNWSIVGGTWRLENGGYAQTDLGRYDLIAYYSRQLTGAGLIQTDLSHVAGEMGGGIVFNAPRNTSKNGAHMVSYTAGGTYIQYGYFDQQGVFQFQGGLNTRSGADGQPHTIAVRVTGTTYEVLLDNEVIARDVPLQGQPGGYAGLLVSTSHVIFDNVVIESTQP